MEDSLSSVEVAEIMKWIRKHSPGNYTFNRNGEMEFGNYWQVISSKKFKKRDHSKKFEENDTKKVKKWLEDNFLKSTEISVKVNDNNKVEEISYME